MYQLILNQTIGVEKVELEIHAIKKVKDYELRNHNVLVCKMTFRLTIDDCNRVTWQTLSVIILSSACVILLSTLAIMLILYQQKGLIGKNRDEDDDQFDRPEDSTFSNNIKDNTFINPRRTSSYEFTNISRHSSMEINIDEVHNA